MVQPCKITIYNGTSHTLKYEIQGKFNSSDWDPKTTLHIESDHWDPPPQDRLVLIETFDPIKVYKKNYLKPFTYIEACYQNDNGDLENYFIQEWDTENELSVIGTLSAFDFLFLVKADSTTCYTIDIIIYRLGDEYRAEVKNPKLNSPDDVRQITIGTVQSDNYSVQREYKEGDPYTCSPFCQTSNGIVPNPTTNCTPPLP
ncbi:hypothetical protein [Bacillus thuringiensis]|uniref:hypothetical protein n=1 Tax=Bacillus thuringiensis TaxID=1428 RepID=UPI0021D684D4|nr:hypothetical protein [Bacillus thuringiensis]MCU7663741.1 hypothetical protein [Bacillus thuringiensis]